jgi:hypothetical protein
LGFAFDLGLIYSTSPDAVLIVAGPDSTNPLLADDIERERQELQNDLDTLNGGLWSVRDWSTNSKWIHLINLLMGKFAPPYRNKIIVFRHFIFTCKM